MAGQTTTTRPVWSPASVVTRDRSDRFPNLKTLFSGLFGKTLSSFAFSLYFQGHLVQTYPQALLHKCLVPILQMLQPLVWPPPMASQTTRSQAVRPPCRTGQTALQDRSDRQHPNNKFDNLLNIEFTLQTCRHLCQLFNTKIRTIHMVSKVWH